MKEPLVVITNNGTDFIKRQSITFVNSYCNILYNNYKGHYFVTGYHKLVPKACLKQRSNHVLSQLNGLFMWY